MMSLLVKVSQLVDPNKIMSNMGRSGILLVLLCGMIIAIDSSLVEDDTFICKKIPKLEGSNSACYEEGDRLKDLEDRLLLMETKLLEQSQMFQMPSVIKMQHDEIPRDCNAIFMTGETDDGVYQISPDGRCAFRVYCNMKRGGWSVIQRRYDGSVDFQRTWLEYVEGFGDLEGEFWLGLEKIHRLTTGGSQIYFTLGNANASLENDWAYYESFAVSDILTGYRMNVDSFGYTGSIEELLSYHDDQKFSTMDRDNDMFSHSCSTHYGGNGGWWYKSCYRLGILNGYFGVEGTGGVSVWQEGPVYVKNTEIKVKPRVGMC